MKQLLLSCVLVFLTATTYSQIQVKEIKKTSSVGRTFSISYYCLQGKTASGSITRPGIVAADPRVFPLGTTIWIQGKKYIVADTGGAIKGLRLDIWVSSCLLARKLGRHKAFVTN